MSINFVVAFAFATGYDGERTTVVGRLATTSTKDAIALDRVTFWPDSMKNTFRHLIAHERFPLLQV